MLREIIHNLWIGDYFDAINNYGEFDVVVSITQPEAIPKFSSNSKPLHFAICVYDDAFPDGVFSTGTQILHNYLNEDKKVLAHCTVGVSRSVALVIAYLNKSVSFGEAYALVEFTGPVIIQPDLLVSLKKYCGEEG